MRIAFYAPMKAPDHPVPSGDRTMARAFLRALRLAGHDVVQPSRLRSFLADPHPERQEGVAAEAGAEADRIAGLWHSDGKPDAWFTYHNHYKAPDLLGPALARRFGLPYVVAEASHAPKRALAWGDWHAAAERAIRAADLHVCLTPRDRVGLASLLKPGAAVLDLPAFLDLDGLPALASPPATAGPVRLTTLAMMRTGDKLASYRALANALTRLTDLPWHLDVIGDGPARDSVEAAFAWIGRERVTWHGLLSQSAAWRQMSHADLFVWPGIGEAFGLAYLEAQALGLPVVAFDTAGVSAVVRHGETGLLVEALSAEHLAEAIDTLIADRAARARMAAAAHSFVTGERTLERASAHLDAALRTTVEHLETRHD